jgi:hypothetical protein
MSVDQPDGSASADSDTALSALQAFVKLQGTRTAIAHEFDDAFAAFFSDPPTIVEDQLQEVIRIATLGLMECSDTAKSGRVPHRVSSAGFSAERKWHSTGHWRPSLGTSSAVQTSLP